MAAAFGDLLGSASRLRQPARLIEEGGQHHGSAEGTVKAHLGAVFRAAGVRTRAGLVGLLMEALLDFAAAPAPRET